MAGKRQKHPNALAFQRGGRARPLAVIDAQPGRSIPRAPEGLGEYAKRAWRAYWSLPVSQIVDFDTHGEALRHWVRCLDTRQKLWMLWKDRPLVKGSHNQVMVNPIWRQIRDLSDEIHRAEEAFGMTPLAQMRLGIAFLEQHSLRRRLWVADREAEIARRRAAEQEDPRQFLRG